MLEIFLKSALISLVTLFPIINPIGAIPVFISLTVDDTAAERRRQVIKISLYVIVILIVFFFIGQVLLSFFGISIYVLKIAGGLVVAHTAWEMVTSKEKISKEEHKEASEKNDISFIPMAMPILGGPGAIGAVIALSSHKFDTEYYTGICGGFILIGIIIMVCLALSTTFFKLLKRTGVNALSRVMGFFILAIAVQMITDGIKFVLQI
jgi:multiple antibiotic resistance protein